jgi:hypothetical protein
MEKYIESKSERGGESVCVCVRERERERERASEREKEREGEGEFVEDCSITSCSCVSVCSEKMRDGALR